MRPVFFDTCAQYDYYLCDTLLQLAEAKLFRPMWSPEILRELRKNLVGHRIGPDEADGRIAAMRRSFPDSEISDYEPMVATLTCDPKDRHVLAAAVKGGAEILVTFNIADFPAESVEGFAVEVAHPDRFLGDLLLGSDTTMKVLEGQAATYKNPPMGVEGLLAKLAKSGVPGFAAAAARHLRY